MSRTIDERIVSMSFDNKQFEKNAGQTIETLGKLKSSLNFDGATNSLKNVQGIASKFNLDAISESFYKVRESFSAMEIAGITAISNITNRAVNAGLSIAKSLTLDQPIAGWNKYSAKTSSVQTLMNSTGKTIEDVNGYLDELMWYSDETSFGFSDMTSALSTMVASGGDINKLIPMIQGMGNAVAYAGKGAAEFSRVIYNLNQSYSTGALKTMDWRSVEFAGAGSKQLKQLLIQGAEEAGAIAKGTGDLSKWSDYLSNGLITSEAMEIGFTKFAEFSNAVKESVDNGTYKNATEALEKMDRSGFDPIAISAFEAAQNYKSFTEAIEAAKDAASTSWMKIFENIFGNYEESKALWTRMGNDLTSLFVDPLSGLEDLSTGWKELWAEQQRIATDHSSTLIAKDALEYVTQTEAVYASLSGLFETIGENLSRGLSLSRFKLDAESLFQAIENFRSGISNVGDFLKTNMSGATKVVTVIANSLSTILKIGSTIFNYLIKPLVSQFKPIIADINSAIYNIASALGVVDSTVDKSLPNFASLLTKIVDSAKPLIDFLGNIVSKLKDFSFIVYSKVFNTLNSDVEDTTSNFNILGKVLDTVKIVIEKVVEFFSSFGNVLAGVKKILSSIVDIAKQTIGSLSGVFESVGNVISNFLNDSSSSLGEIAGGGIFAVLLLNINNLVKGLSKLAKGENSLLDFKKIFGEILNGGLGALKDIPKKISDTLNSVTESLQNMQKAKINTETIKSIGKALLEIAAALLIVSSIDSGKMQDAVLALSVIIGELVLTVIALNEFTAGKKIGNVSKTIVSIGAALLLIATSLKIIGSLDTEQIQNGVLALSTMLLVLGTVTGVMAHVATTFKKRNNVKAMKAMSSAMKSIGFALLEISVALKIVSGLSIGEAAIAVLSLGSMILILSGCALLMEKHQSSFKVFGSTSALLGFGLIEMAAALKICSTMQVGEAAVAVISLGAIIAILAGISLLIKNNKAGFVTMSASMVLLAPSLLVIAAALKILSTMNLESALVAVGSLSLIMAAIAGFTALISLTGGGLNFIAVAAGLLIMSSALTVLAGVITVLGKLSWKTIGSGIGKLAATLAVLGGMGALLGLLSPLLLLAAAALTAFSGALIIMGNAMLKISEATILFGMFKESISKNILSFMTSAVAAIVEVIPALILGICEAIINCAGKLIEMIGTIIQIVCQAIADNLPTIIETLVSIIEQVLGAVVDLSDNFIETGWTILENVLKGIEEHLPEVLTMGSNIAQELVRGICQEIPNLVDAFLEGIVTLVNGVATAIDENSADIGAAFGNLAASIIKATVKGIGSAVATFGGELWEGAKEIGQGICSFFSGSDESTEQTNNSGKNVIDGISKGMNDNKDTLMETANTIGEDLTDELDRNEDAKTSGTNTISGFMGSIQSKINDGSLYSLGVSAGNSFMSGLNSSYSLDIHSPSKATAKSAKFAIAGFINTISDNLSKTQKSGTSLGNSVLTGLATAIGLADSILDEDLSPTITPVLDLSNIQAGASGIDSLLGADRSLSLAAGISNQNGGQPATINNSPTINVNFSVSNAGKDLSTSDIQKYGRMIADEVNQQLGLLL